MRMLAVASTDHHGGAGPMVISLLEEDNSVMIMRLAVQAEATPKKRTAQ